MVFKMVRRVPLPRDQFRLASQICASARKPSCFSSKRIGMVERFANQRQRRYPFGAADTNSMHFLVMSAKRMEGEVGLAKP